MSYRLSPRTTKSSCSLGRILRGLQWRRTPRFRRRRKLYIMRKHLSDNPAGGATILRREDPHKRRLLQARNCWLDGGYISQGEDEVEEISGLSDAQILEKIRELRNKNNVQQQPRAGCTRRRDVAVAQAGPGCRAAKGPLPDHERRAVQLCEGSEWLFGEMGREIASPR